MRIAVLGIRGVPANFGGSETAAEEIGSRLAQRGHQVTVYCRRHQSAGLGSASYKGMRRIVLPSVNTLQLDLMTHSGLSLMQMLREHFDVVHFHGVGNALLLPQFRLTGHGARSLVIVDGPDWLRPKWGALARVAFRASFPLAARWADQIISDNVQVQALFRERYGRDTPLVGYGADPVRPASRAALEKYGLPPNGYILQVGALVPDKGAQILLEAYEKLATNVPLVIIGDTPYRSAFKTRLKGTTDPRIRFLGYLYGEEYRQILANCRLYIHPLLVDGTSPALLQAMAYGCNIIGSDLPEIDGTLADAGLRFAAGDAAGLRRQMSAALARPDRMAELGRKAQRRVREHFNWEEVTDRYEQLSEDLL